MMMMILGGGGGTLKDDENFFLVLNILTVDEENLHFDTNDVNDAESIILYLDITCLEFADILICIFICILNLDTCLEFADILYFVKNRENLSAEANTLWLEFEAKTTKEEI